MISKNIPPDKYHLSIKLNAYIKTRKIEKAYNFFTKVRDEYKVDTSLYNSMIAGFIKFGLRDHAKQIFEEMKTNNIKRDAVTFTIMIHSCVEGGFIEEAEHYFKMAQEEGVRPDIYMYSALIDVYAHNKRNQKINETLEKMKQDGITPNIVIFNSLITASPQEYTRILKMMEEHGVSPNYYFLSNVMIKLTNNGKPKEATDFFEQYRNTVELDVGCYNEYIKALVRQGRLSEAEKTIASMREKGMRLTNFTYAPLLGNYIQMKRFDKIRETIREMEEYGVKLSKNTQMWKERVRAIY